MGHESEVLTKYNGSSEGRKNWGLAIFPIQYAANIRALTVLFLVNPATFKLIRLRQRDIGSEDTTQAETGYLPCVVLII